MHPRLRQFLVLIGGLLICNYVFGPGKCGEDWLREQCAAENKQWAGHVFNGEARCDRILQGPGMKLTFEYTIVNHDASEFPPGFEAKMKEAMLAESAIQKALRAYSEKGVAVECNLYSRDQKMVM